MEIVRTQIFSFAYNVQTITLIRAHEGEGKGEEERGRKGGGRRGV
jgi:hypothetical protein